MALGASNGSVMRLVMRDAFRMTLAGLALGLVCVPLVARALRSLLVGVGPLDIPTIGDRDGCAHRGRRRARALPARRATAVSPTDALRNG